MIGKASVDEPGTFYHIIVRGIEQAWIFKKEQKRMADACACLKLTYKLINAIPKT